MPGLKVFVLDTKEEDAPKLSAEVLVEPTYGAYVNKRTRFKNVEALPDWIQEAIAVLDMMPIRQALPDIGYRTQGPVRRVRVYILYYKGKITCITCNEQL